MKRTLALAVVAASLSAVPAPVQAQEAIEEVLREFGLAPRNKKPIEYKERAPLVLPPSAEALPEPQQQTAVNDPSWPTDPDSVRAAQEAELMKKPPRERRKYQERPVMWPQELQQQRRAPVETAGDWEPFIKRQDKKLTREEMALGTKSDEPVAFVAEPPRRRLTDPPPGYQTPSPNQPYAGEDGEKPKGEGWFSKLNPF